MLNFKTLKDERRNKGVGCVIDRTPERARAHNYIEIFFFIFPPGLYRKVCRGIKQYMALLATEIQIQVRKGNPDNPNH